MLRRDFQNLFMKESESLQVYFTISMNVVNQIKTHGEELSDQKIDEKLLQSLLIKYDPIIIAIGETKTLATYSIDELMGTLYIHE